MKNYLDALEMEGSGGAVLLAVLRGKVSEGMDFADSQCRAVIITGLAYPPCNDPRVVLKREYMKNVQKKNGMVSNVTCFFFLWRCGLGLNPSILKPIVSLFDSFNRSWWILTAVEMILFYFLWLNVHWDSAGHYSHEYISQGHFTRIFHEDISANSVLTAHLH